MIDRAKPFEQALAEAFFREVIASDEQWSALLAKIATDKRASQSTYRAGAPGTSDSLEETYRKWVYSVEDLEDREIELALGLMENVLFNAAKFVSTLAVDDTVKIDVDMDMSESAAMMLAQMFESTKVNRTATARFSFTFKTKTSANTFEKFVGSYLH